MSKYRITEKAVLGTGILLLSGICMFQAKQINTLEQNLEEVAIHVSYDIQKHQPILDEAEEEQLVSAFLQSELYTSRLLASTNSQEKLFSMTDEPYYILFQQENCSHCRELEATMAQKMDSLPTNLYYFDASTVGESNDIQWEEDADLTQASYTVSKEDFLLRGTPSLVKVEKDKDLQVFLGNESISEELGLE